MFVNASLIQSSITKDHTANLRYDINDNILS
uniref:Uncharacterized protein n=1 Tax=Rhizophora mucronata TaxID=61149 RepID=A0A2P2Q1J3_RHIMU